ncbi:probable E3 ubiquitin-protein ligase EDA40 isoform X2 [Mercurialis annua]|uniref:probable E3 ubiquitin-protein ligase EDA40 isoform X2 n=1 Tax=Mercurialis annua TaxID=3986 RepID=UPI00215EA651|nr:probable E3 ubiquitin-protein ligase EDA40 isoform X2 [Mercurialis annua]
MGVSSKLRKAARTVAVAACSSFSCTKPSPAALADVDHPHSYHFSITGSDSSALSLAKPEEAAHCSTLDNHNDRNVNCKKLCAICLEALSYSKGNTPGQAIFTAQCSHSFHFACISSNVRHGSVTCPICRAHWTQLPRNLNPPCSLSCTQSDPVFQILDDSIATFRVHRRSFLRSARYNDDDPIEPDDTSTHSRLHFSLVPIPLTLFHHPFTQPSGWLSHCQYPHHPSSLFSHPPSPHSYTSNVRLTPAYLSVQSTQQRAIDMVLITSPNGPHLRLVKQSMALVVFSLRPIDRLAIVTYSSLAARVFPLRRMTSYGKRTALQVIDRLFFTGQADPTEGLKKGIKILDDRAYKNPRSCILHLSDSPVRPYHTINNIQVNIPIHRFHLGFGLSTSNGFVMHEFEEFLVRIVGGVVRDVQLRIGEEGRIVRVGELRGNDERRVVLEIGEDEDVCVGYSYVEGENDECTKTGEIIVSLEDRREADHDNSRGSSAAGSIIGGRSSNAESWDYHDPHMARRWAKHLHGCRL